LGYTWRNGCSWGPKKLGALCGRPSCPCPGTACSPPLGDEVSVSAAAAVSFPWTPDFSSTSSACNNNGTSQSQPSKRGSRRHSAILLQRRDRLQGPLERGYGDECPPAIRSGTASPHDEPHKRHATATATWRARQGRRLTRSRRSRGGSGSVRRGRGRKGTAA
jgi:hypothetical protein